MTQSIDLTGERFGRLIALRRAGRATNGNALWLCQCDCGQRLTTDSYRLRHGRTRSCGCLRAERSRTAIFAQPATRAMMAAPIRATIDFTGPLNMSARNTSGVTGVSWDKHAHRWVARLMLAERLVLNQQFASFDAAVAARHQAERLYHVAPRQPRKEA